MQRTVLGGQSTALYFAVDGPGDHPRQIILPYLVRGGGGGPRRGDQLSCDRTTDIKLCSFPLLIGLVIDRGAVMCGLSGLTQ